MKRVLISGGSIAGPVLAHWLARYGFETTIVEKASAIRTGGYAVDVRGSAIDVVDRMGLLPQLRRQGTDTRATSFVDKKGKRVATMERGFGIIDEADLEIMRGDLADILYRATKDRTRFVFGDSITSLEETAEGVDVSFERGAPARYDLVIGADGLHSNVRRLVFGAETQFLHHLGSYMAIFSAPNFLDLDRWQLMQNLPGKVVSIKPVTGNGALKVTTFFSSPPISYDYRDVAEQRRLVAAAFAADGWEVPRLLAAMQQAEDFYFDSTSQVRMSRWSKGRVALVGDACACPSPLTGQGTSMALVGAYVLAGEIAAAAGNHHRAFAAYESCLRGFVERNQKGARDVAKNFAPQSEFGIWLRDLNFRLMPYMPWSKWVFKLVMREIAQAARAVGIRDYAPAAPSGSHA